MQDGIGDFFLFKFSTGFVHVVPDARWLPMTIRSSWLRWHWRDRLPIIEPVVFQLFDTACGATHFDDYETLIFEMRLCATFTKGSSNINCRSLFNAIFEMFTRSPEHAILKIMSYELQNVVFLFLLKRVSRVSLDHTILVARKCSNNKNARLASCQLQYCIVLQSANSAYRVWRIGSRKS